MSAWRQIWAEAVLANREFALNRAKGEMAFKQLLEAYPDDGMVYYERGEAYEYLKEFDLAESAYIAAEKLFPVPHWKAVAREGINRIQRKRQNPSESDRQWSVLHRIHAVPQIPHEVRLNAIFAIARFDAEPKMAAGQLRACLEELVVTLLDNVHIEHSDIRDLGQLTHLLSQAFAIPSLLVEKMDTVRDLGNKGLHVKARKKRVVNFSPSASEFADIVEWIGTHVSQK